MSQNQQEKIKELREWGTFAVSLLTVVVLPLILLFAKNQRLEIQIEADRKYQTKEDATAFQSNTNSKLDKINEAVDATRQSIADLKTQLATARRNQ